MKHILLSPLFLVLMLLPSKIYSQSNISANQEIFNWNYPAQYTQSYFSIANSVIALKSDTTSNSVLISNLFEDLAGYQSPVIGVASWMDNGKLRQCNSFLQFDFNMIPVSIKEQPNLIASAELVLTPLQFDLPEKEEEIQPARFLVKRVIQSWVDSLTTWQHQPLGKSDDQVIKKIAPKDQNYAVRINVTEMVKDMIMYGNHGFMLSYEEASKNYSEPGQWFASPKNQNERMRPQLIIRYAHLQLERGYPEEFLPKPPVYQNNPRPETLKPQAQPIVPASNNNNNKPMNGGPISRI